MNKKKSIKKVESPKRTYFIPEWGISVEAASLEEAIRKAGNEKVEAGDGNK